MVNNPRVGGREFSGSGLGAAAESLTCRSLVINSVLYAAEIFLVPFFAGASARRDKGASGPREKYTLEDGSNGDTE